MKRSLPFIVCCALLVTAVNGLPAGCESGQDDVKTPSGLFGPCGGVVTCDGEVTVFALSDDYSQPWC